MRLEVVRADQLTTLPCVVELAVFAQFFEVEVDSSACRATRSIRRRTARAGQIVSRAICQCLGQRPSPVYSCAVASNCRGRNAVIFRVSFIRLSIAISCHDGDKLEQDVKLTQLVIFLHRSRAWERNVQGRDRRRGARAAARRRRCCASTAIAGPITLVGEEPIAPYQRPPLSKAWLKGEADAEALALKPRELLRRARHRPAPRPRASAIDRARARPWRSPTARGSAYDT